MSDAVKTIICSECGVHIHTAYVMREGKRQCLHCAGYKKDLDQEEDSPERQLSYGLSVGQKIGT